MSNEVRRVPGHRTLQFRSAGPMILPNYTDEELSRVREAVNVPNSKVKFVALCRRNDGSLLVFAQAHEKLSAKAWRRMLGPRMHNVVPSSDCIKGIKQCQGVELDPDTGEYTRLIQGVTDPVVQCEEFGETGWSRHKPMCCCPKQQTKEETEMNRVVLISERERKHVMESYICKFTALFVEACQASHRAAMNAYMEIHRVTPDFFK